MFLYYFFFFFSSRRRHTRCLSDWSSDVCSSDLPRAARAASRAGPPPRAPRCAPLPACASRSEEHTSELQSLRHLVCRLLLEKKKNEKTRLNEIHPDDDTVDHIMNRQIVEQARSE